MKRALLFCLIFVVLVTPVAVMAQGPGEGAPVIEEILAVQPISVHLTPSVATIQPALAFGN